MYRGYAYLHAIDIPDLDTQADLLTRPGRRVERQDRQHQWTQPESGVVVGAKKSKKKEKRFYAVNEMGHSNKKVKL